MVVVSMVSGCGVNAPRTGQNSNPSPNFDGDPLSDDPTASPNDSSVVPDDSPSSSSDTPEFSITGDYRVIAPGGSGAFTGTAVHPDDSNFLLVGTELNGIFRSQDGGVSFVNVSRDLRSRRVFEIKIVKNGTTVYAFAATDDGVYRSDNLLGTLGDHWALKENGFQDGCASVDNCSTQNGHPVSTLAVNSKNPNIVWAGISQTMHGNTINTYRPTDPYKVYVSVDSGENWSPVFSLVTEADLNNNLADIEVTRSSVGPNVYSIFVDPTDNMRVTVATDRGLYFTDNASKSNITKGTLEWYELGRSKIYISTDKGLNWKNCSLANVECADEFESLGVSGNVCLENKVTKGCLPIEKNMDETHPNIRKAVWSQGRLYVLANDFGWAGGKKSLLTSSTYANTCETDSTGEYYINCLSSCQSPINSTSAKDSSFTFYRGGVWYSDDYGLTWTYLNEDAAGNKTPHEIRCSIDMALDSQGTTKSISTEKNTSFAFLEVNPADKNNLVIGVPFVRSGKQGFYEYLNDRWVHIRDVCDLDTSTNKVACYEGGNPTGLWGPDVNSQSPGPYGMTVADWDNLTVYYGHIMGYHKIVRSGEAYSVTDLTADPVGDTGYWKSSGADLHCPFAGVQTLKNNLFIGAVDVGVLKSQDDGESWKLVTENNSNLLDVIGLEPDDTWALIADDNSLYAHSFNGSKCSSRTDGCHSILKSDSTGENWEVIGGTMYEASSCSYSSSTREYCEGNGYPMAFKTLDFAFDYSRSSKRRLFAATEGGGIYVYDSTLAKGQQWNSLGELGDSTCSEFVMYTGKNNFEENLIVNDLWSSPDYPSLILAAVAHKDNPYGNRKSRQRNEGIMAIQVSKNNISCHWVGNTTAPACDDGSNCEPLAPNSVALTKYKNQNYIVATGKMDLWPAIYSTPIDLNDLTTSHWQLALDFKQRNGNNWSASKNWWSYLQEYPDWSWEYEHSKFWVKQFSSLAVHPTKPQVIVATMADSIGVDYNMSRHVYESLDGGQTWAVGQDFETLPTKSFWKAQFDATGSKMYLSGKCTSLYEMTSPY